MLMTVDTDVTPCSLPPKSMFTESCKFLPNNNDEYCTIIYIVSIIKNQSMLELENMLLSVPFPSLNAFRGLKLLFK